MAFWKKSEDPWDMPPKRPASPPSQEQEAEQESLLGSVRDWAARKRAAQADRLTLPKEVCPWCGQEMEQGFLSGSHGIFWVRGVPDTKTMWLGAGKENTLRVDDDGDLFTTYKTAWHCPSCEKIMFSAAGLKPAGSRLSFLKPPFGSAPAGESSPYTGVFGETPPEDDQP